MTVKKYIANVDLLAQGKTATIGQEIELDDSTEETKAEVAALLKQGHISVPKAEEKTSKTAAKE